MKGQSLVAVVLGAIIGSGVSTLAIRQPEALAQVKERKAVWEYKVVFSRAREMDQEKAMTDQFAGLAKDGWEYVGPVVNRTQMEGPTGSVVVTGAYVLFRRPN